MRLQLVRAEVGGHKLGAVHLLEARADRGQQLALPGPGARGDGAGVLGGRRAQAAQLHRQRADQGFYLGRQQAGDQPVEARRRQGEQLRHGNVEADAVLLLAGTVRIAQADALAGEFEMIGKQRGDVGVGAGPDHVGLAHAQLGRRRPALP